LTTAKQRIGSDEWWRCVPRADEVQKDVDNCTEKILLDTDAMFLKALGLVRRVEDGIDELLCGEMELYYSEV